MRVCSVIGCPTLYSGTETRCQAHRSEARAKRTANRVYSTAGHRGFRNEVLQRDPICTACEIAQSTVADHYPTDRVDLVDQGLDANDPQYGRGLCALCHNRHTAATRPSGWNAPR